MHSVELSPCAVFKFFYSQHGMLLGGLYVLLTLINSPHSEDV